MTIKLMEDISAETDSRSSAARDELLSGSANYHSENPEAVM